MLRYYGKYFVRKLSFWLVVSAIAGILGGILAETLTDNSNVTLYVGFYISLIALTFVMIIWHKWRKRNSKDITSTE